MRKQIRIQIFFKTPDFCSDRREDFISQQQFAVVDEDKTTGVLSTGQDKKRTATLEIPCKVNV